MGVEEFIEEDEVVRTKSILRFNRRLQKKKNDREGHRARERAVSRHGISWKKTGNMKKTVTRVGGLGDDFGIYRMLELKREREIFKGTKREKYRRVQGTSGNYCWTKGSFHPILRRISSCPLWFKEKIF